MGTAGMPRNRVLVVDDEPDMAAFLASTLAGDGMEVTIAYGGKEALQQLDRSRPDLIVLDIMMEHPSEGVDLARAVCRRPDAPPIVMVTGADAAYGLLDQADAETLGCNRLLAKPVTPHQLVAAVRDALSGPPTGARVDPGRRKVQIALAVLVTLATLLFAPRQADAQCSMGGGGHSHGAAAAGTVDRKTQKAIGQILANEATRRAFVDAALNDTVFMRLLLGRVAQDPQWRPEAEAALGLGGDTVEAQGGAEEQVGEGGNPGSETAAALFGCPMHAEVTSRRPGTCRKCGMTLRRVR